MQRLKTVLLSLLAISVLAGLVFVIYKLDEAIASQNVFELCRAGNLGILKQRLDSDPTLVNTPDENGVYLLTIAAAFGHAEIVAYLIENKADIDASGALLAAAKTGNVEILRDLVENGADVNIRNRIGLTPLYCAAFWAPRGHQEIIHYLLDSGADILVKNNEDVDLLYFLVANCDYRNTKRVLEMGYPVELANRYDPDCTIYEFAKEKCGSQMVSLLREYQGAKEIGSGSK